MKKKQNKTEYYNDLWEVEMPKFVLNREYKWIEPFLEGGFGYIGNGMFVFENDDLLYLSHEDVGDRTPSVIGKIVK